MLLVCVLQWCLLKLTLTAKGQRLTAEEEIRQSFPRNLQGCIAGYLHESSVEISQEDSRDNLVYINKLLHMAPPA